MLNLYQIAKYHSIRRPQDLAIADRTRRLTTVEFVQTIKNISGLLHKHQVRPGDRVVAVLENSIEYLALIYATALLRCILVPVNIRYSADEIQYVVETSEPKVVLFQSKFGKLVCAATALQPELTIHDVDQAGWSGSPPDYSRMIDRFGDADADDVAMIIFTSGTTSRPKGAMLTHGNLVWNSINNIVELGLNSSSRSVMATPLFHISGLGVLNGPILYAGGAVYIMPRFDADELFNVLHDFKPTNLSLLSVMWVQFTDCCRGKSAVFPDVKAIQTAAAPLSEDRQAEIRGLFPNAEWGWGFGMTESCVTTIRSQFTREIQDNPGAIGYPWRHVRFRLVDDDGRELEDYSEVGELEIQAPTVFAGYWGDEKGTNEALTEDRWLRTGDLFRFDKSEFAYFVGRSKDMVKSGGENIAALEVETYLLKSPDVHDVAVFGVPHSVWGEELVAVVVPASGSSVSPQAIIEFARTTLSHFKVPKRVILVPDLPRSSSGKVQKHKLKEHFLEV